MAASQEILQATAMYSDPTKFVMAAPALIAGVTAAAKAFTIVHQSEMGVRTRRGSPMLKPEVQDIVMGQIALELAPSSIPLRSAYDGLSKNEQRELVEDKIANLPEDIKEKGIYQIVGKGVFCLVPFVDRVVKINVADQMSTLGEFPLESTDGRQVIVDPSITWNVRPESDNPYKALFRINNVKEAKLKEQTKELEQTVSKICASGLGMVLRGRTYDNLMNFDPTEITTSTQELCHDSLIHYGVSLKEVWVNPIVRTPAERIAQAIESSPDSPIAGVAATAIAADNTGRVLRIAPTPDDAA